VSVTIKSNGPCDIDAKVTGVPLPQPKRLYNYTRYTAGDSPIDLAAGQPVTTTSAKPGRGGEQANDGDTGTAWRPLPLAGQSWQVDLGRWYTLSGIEMTFPKAPAGLERNGKAYQIGYTVEVSKDGQEWVTVVDRTDNDWADRTQRALFTGLGQYVRVTITELPPGAAVYAKLAELAVVRHRCSSLPPAADAGNVVAAVVAPQSWLPPAGVPASHRCGCLTRRRNGRLGETHAHLVAAQRDPVRSGVGDPDDPLICWVVEGRERDEHAEGPCRT